MANITRIHAEREPLLTPADVAERLAISRDNAYAFIPGDAAYEKRSARGFWRSHECKLLSGCFEIEPVQSFL